jgi:hypothetical protein
MRKHNATASSQLHRQGTTLPNRAELVGILGALQQGCPSIMTDSVDSVHAIRAAMYYPAQIRYHRHKHLLVQMKTENTNDRGKRRAAN